MAFFDLPNGGFIEVVAPTGPESVLRPALETFGYAVDDAFTCDGAGRSRSPAGGAPNRSAAPTRTTQGSEDLEEHAVNHQKGGCEIARS